MDSKYTNDPRFQKLERVFSRYPKMPGFITVGNISLKMARELLDIDRYEMRLIFLELVETNLIKVTSGCNSFRATPELREYMIQRREQEKKQEGATNE